MDCRECVCVLSRLFKHVQYVCMHACTHVYIYIYIYIHIHTYLCIVSSYWFVLLLSYLFTASDLGNVASWYFCLYLYLYLSLSLYTYIYITYINTQVERAGPPRKYYLYEELTRSAETRLAQNTSNK